MAKAKMGGLECEVRCTRDLTDNWAVEISPILAHPRKGDHFKPNPSPLILKVRSDSREAAIEQALKTLKELKRIDDFTL